MNQQPPYSTNNPAYNACENDFVSDEHQKARKLKIYRASAGSGKTFTLTKEYLRLLFANPSDYRRILAVTFTNKATSEMRTRILESLYKMIDDTAGKSEYLTEFIKEFNLSEIETRQRAALILYYLLHDYSRFTVNTIDSFFQQIIRSFARETGLNSNFKIEMQPDLLILQAIDNMLFEIELPKNTDLKKWLIEFAETRIEEDKNWNITSEISDMFKKLIDSEIYQENSRDLTEKLNDKKNLKIFLEQLKNIINETDSALKSIGTKGIDIIESRGLDINNDFYKKSLGPVRIFAKLKTFTMREFINEKSYKTLINNPEKWIQKDSSKYKQTAVLDAFHAGLNQLLINAVELIYGKSADYFTAQAILENLYALGIISDVNKKLNEICNEKNLFIISKSNYLLNSIIDNNETPFLYEKTGAFFSHFMIDEFQDTSMLQYRNFVPLINESLSNDCFSLFVGDVKQAIYRWRNSDWNLLAETAEKSFQKFGSEINVLDVNWRSSEDIIEFNNNFFMQAPAKLQSAFNALMPEDLQETELNYNLKNKIENIYSDVYQKVSPQKIGSGGNIDVCFYEGSKKDNEEKLIKHCVSRIICLTDSGVKKSEICVLVRKNKESVLITNALLSGEYNPKKEPIGVFSSESLLLSSSEAVNVLIAQLMFLKNPDDALIESFIRMVFNKYNSDIDSDYDVTRFSTDEEIEKFNNYKEILFNIAHLPLYELVELLINNLPQTLATKDSIFLQSFLSIVHDFVAKEYGDADLFLEYWDKNKEKTALAISDNDDCVRVMTIHKAKGLEFKAVILPFFNWEVKEKANQTNYIWAMSENERFNYLKIVPLILKNNLVYSHYSSDFLSEILCQHVDNLNLVYVAFTRAKESISISANINKTDVNKIQTVADLLFSILTENEMLTSSEEGIYTYKKGNVSVTDELNVKLKKRKEINVEIPFSKHYPLRDRIEFHLDSIDYIDDNKRVVNILQGKIMHRLFENIITKNDIDKALNELKHKGIIKTTEQTLLKEFVLEKINNPDVKDWFEGVYQVKTEANIIYQNDKRPDRVMFSQNEVIVVDYKFGNFKSNEHLLQVESYIQLLKEMGYNNVKGFVWYVNLNLVVGV